MSAPQFASLTAGLLARKGEAKPSQEPVFGSKPWQPPVVPAAPASPSARPLAVPRAAAAASNDAPDVNQMKVKLQEVAAVWPQAKPNHAADVDGTGWIPAGKLHGSHPPLNSYGQPVKTTIRLTHAQARAVKLAALVLDKPQQEILTAGLLGKLEALACTDLSSCNCFKAVLEGLKQPDTQAGEPGQSDV